MRALLRPLKEAKIKKNKPAKGAKNNKKSDEAMAGKMGALPVRRLLEPAGAGGSLKAEINAPTGGGVLSRAASRTVDETKRRVNLAVHACQWSKLVLRRPENLVPCWGGPAGVSLLERAEWAALGAVSGGFAKTRNSVV